MTGLIRWGIGMRLTLLISGWVVLATAAIAALISLRVNAFAKKSAVAYAKGNRAGTRRPGAECDRERAG